MGGFGAIQAGTFAPEAFDAVVSVAGYGLGTSEAKSGYGAPQPRSGASIHRGDRGGFRGGLVWRVRRCWAVFAWEWGGRGRRRRDGEVGGSGEKWGEEERWGGGAHEHEIGGDLEGEEERLTRKLSLLENRISG